MDSGLFSIVIPAYNREKTIGRTIQSVLNQTYQQFEVLVIDDGSKDNTKGAVDPFLNDNRVSYIHQENGGAQRARNNGLNRSSGEYILFLDSDDELLPNCLEKVVKKYEEDPELGSVYFIAGVRKNGKLVPMRKDHLEGWIYKEVLEQGYLTSSSFITMRRSIFDTIGEWDVAFPASQDDDICFRTAKNYKIGFIKEILGIYYFDAGKGNQISSSPLRVANGWWILWNKYEKDVIDICGKGAIRKHYTKCAYRYKKCKDASKIKKCKEKLRINSNHGEYILCQVKIYCLFMKNELKGLILKAIQDSEKHKSEKKQIEKMSAKK